MSERVVRAAALSLVVAATLGVAAFGAPAPILAVIRSAAFAEAHAAEAPKIFHGVGVVTAIDAESGRSLSITAIFPASWTRWRWPTACVPCLWPRA